ncbi:hypothetical protein AGABI2DRAFT_148229 [Agaricus bisporus var. bisporus H97]|uniref:hypothetical protein n=1 Tax=Agaricus bisporus var. bisporus (strain H97 / ATCC MYA-4626 / FGSC 10389) TaxID=936046 RepID=UPI00029F77E5|nr:hypothetical protein AGABI2DRAFT_148229 [Agaricus bisporus var. bisporus H97]EKV51945.1 hypothetical protein AGABI2DRAFT_148229 [Agaricus bisporus var. bisporus H97]
MSVENINELCAIHDDLLQHYGDVGPFASASQMYETIDSIQLGDAPWLHLQAVIPHEQAENAPSWKKKLYDIWYRDPDVVLKQMLENPDFNGEFDYAPYIDLDMNGERVWSGVMSGNYAWHPLTAGAMYCPLICGTDKTTVSVATGHVEYHPGYISIGNLHNNVQRAHQNSVIPFIFFPIPKNDRKDNKDPEFRTFKKQLFHQALSTVFSSLKPAMSKPVIRRLIYDFAAFIGDYPEQVVLAGIVQGWCAKLDDYGIDSKIVVSVISSCSQILATNQGNVSPSRSFKDHLVTWVGEYLEIQEGKVKAATIMDDIDRRIAAAPAFPGLCRFPEGRRFKQWTGDDSKALMKVYLPALVGYVLSEMLWALASFLEFCYIARQPCFSLRLLDQLEEELNSFHQSHEIFQETGVRPKVLERPPAERDP